MLDQFLVHNKGQYAKRLEMIEFKKIGRPQSDYDHTQATHEGNHGKIRGKSSQGLLLLKRQDFQSFSSMHFFSFKTISLCSLGYPGTLSAGLAGIKEISLLGLKVCTATVNLKKINKKACCGVHSGDRGRQGSVNFWINYKMQK